MSLPKGKDKERLIKEGKKANQIAADKERKRRQDEKNLKQKEEKKQFDSLVSSYVEHIEEAVLYAIKRGKKETSFIIPANYAEDRYLEAWERAVSRLKRSYGKDYTFKISPKTISCDNASEAANVDYVSYREWTEDVHELTATW